MLSGIPGEPASLNEQEYSAGSKGRAVGSVLQCRRGLMELLALCCLS